MKHECHGVRGTARKPSSMYEYQGGRDCHSLLWIVVSVLVQSTRCVDRNHVPLLFLCLEQSGRWHRAIRVLVEKEQRKPAMSRRYRNSPTPVSPSRCFGACLTDTDQPRVKVKILVRSCLTARGSLPNHRVVTCSTSAQPGSPRVTIWLPLKHVPPPKSVVATVHPKNPPYASSLNRHPCSSSDLNRWPRP